MERAADLFLFRINRLAAVAGRPLTRLCDRRYIEIHLTERGREVYASLYPSVVQIDAHLLSGLDPQEREVLQKLWKRLEESASHLTEAVPGLPKTNRRRK